MKIFYGLLCLFFLIFFHELGHFIAAKIFGVKVESFSLGIGPFYLHKTIRGTDYRLSLIPLGGYCGLKGEKDFTKSLEAKLDHIEAEPDSFYGIHPFKRCMIAFAGPFFNLLFSVISFSLINGIGYTYYSYSNQIKLADEVYPELHSAARDAGILSGDKIIQINNLKIENFSDMLTEIGSNPDKDISVIVERDGQEMTFTVHTDFDKENGIGKIGVVADENSIEQFESPKYSFFGAIGHGFIDTGKYIGLTFKGLAVLFKGADVTNSASGPAKIADMMGGIVKESFSASFKAGIINMLNFMGLISISLGIMNLLPIPVFDGGLILFAIIECISHRKMSPKVLYYIQFVGVAIIALLFLIGLLGDVKYFMRKL